MIFNFSDGGRKLLTRCGKKLIFAVLISFLISGGAFGQTNLSREQFSHFNLRTRAAYFENEILQVANTEGVDPNLLWTIAYNETRFRPWLTSPKNARGLMQFIPATAARFGLENPYSSREAIRAAARYVRVLSNLFGGRVDSILAAYNSGEGTVSAYFNGQTLRDGKKIINPNRLKTIGGVPPYTETIGYVGRGLKIYRWLIMRGAFPGGMVRANFPTAISAVIARVGVFDRELGNVPDFNNHIPLTQTSRNQLTPVDSVVTETEKAEGNQSSPSGLTEVYYDSRSGSRYLLNNGKREKLAELGYIIVNYAIRPETTNRARSTFFAAPSNK